jgi:hypothetical protein
MRVGGQTVCLRYHRAVGGYRATSMAINRAGIQLDANMADFRFPPTLR